LKESNLRRHYLQNVSPVLKIFVSVFYELLAPFMLLNENYRVKELLGDHIASGFVILMENYFEVGVQIRISNTEIYWWNARFPLSTAGSKIV